jgi:hypothetical protein
MSQTEIYISITHGSETLTVDGTLSLFEELIATLHDSARGLTQSRPVLGTKTPTADLKEGSHVTD